MLSNHETNSTFMGTLQNKLKDIKNFSQWSAKEQMLAVSAAGMIFGAALPVLAVALPVATAGAIVALTLFFAVKAVEYTFKGLKWSAEKTVEGAKYTAGKIKDGAVHVKDKVKKGASVVGEGMANKLHKASGETDYLDKIKRFTSEKLKKSDEIRNDMKEIFADKGNNSELVKNILSEISSKIDSKIAEEAKSGRKEYTPNWQIQKEFINNLNEKSLHHLLTERSLPKGTYFIDGVFSEHYDEIKEVIKECKENHLYSSMSNMFEKAEKKANKPSFKSLTKSVSSSFSSLGRKDSEQSSSLSRNSSLDSINTDSSEAELLNPAEHKKVTQSKSFSSWFRKSNKVADSGATTAIEYQSLPSTPLATIGARRSNSKGSIPVAPVRPPRSFVGIGDTLHSQAKLTRSNSVSSLASDDSFISASSHLSANNSSIASKSNSFTYYNNPDSGISSPGSSMPSGLDYISSPDDLHNTSLKLQKQGYFGEQAAYVLEKKQNFAVIDTKGHEDSIGYRSDSDSGFNSPTPSPVHAMVTDKDGTSKTQADLKKTGYLELLVQQPSTKVGIVKQEPTQVRQSREIWV